jgi:putative nucleotidyltransferase with HDIG domain
MQVDPTIREGVKRSLPEAEWIKDESLRAKVYDAWALALSHSEYGSIEEIPASGNPDSPPLKAGTQAHHIRGVTRLAVRMAEELEVLLGALGIDRDLLIAGGLCHDVGKPFEFSRRNQQRWGEDPRPSGKPALRHTLYGVHVCLTVGLPEAVAHVAGCHSLEGQFVEKSLIAEIVHRADYAFWSILSSAGALTAKRKLA